MTYEHWIKEHSLKHKKIVEKLHYLNDDDLIEYFDFDNMVKHEKEFCLLYKDNKKCHDIENLNCYLCACPHFRLSKEKSTCSINSIFGGQFKSNDGFVHQDCSSCIIPHSKQYIKKHFTRNWEYIMKDVKENK